MNPNEDIPSRTIQSPPSNDGDEPDNQLLVHPIVAAAANRTASRVVRAGRPAAARVRGRRQGAGTYHLAERMKFFRNHG